MNFIDKIINAVNPNAGAKRMRARMVISILGDHQRKYEAAGKGRRANGWPVRDGSANQDLATDLITLRARARHMVKNNAYARKAVNVIVNNTVGTGILLQPVSESSQKVKKFKALWRQFAETTACDYNGQLNFYGLQSLIMRTVAMSGECLILRRRTGKYKLQFQVLEGDFLDHGKDLRDRPGGGYIAQGVEYDGTGKIKGYWIFDQHPADFGTFGSKFRPVSEVLHVYDMERPGQSRGVPFGVSSFLRLKDFDDYEDAEVVKQKVAACFAAFVQDADPASAGAPGSESEMLERLEPGVIEHLPPGKQIAFANPPTTNSYADFSRKILQGVAAGWGITYEAMTGDLSNVNFSSGRMGWLEFHRQVSSWQYNMLIPMFCEKAAEWFVDVSVIANGFKRGDLYFTWTPPRREMIDPVKETNAIRDLVRSGLSSWSEEVRAQGHDPEELIEEIKRDQDRFDKHGMTLDSDSRYPKRTPGQEGSKPANDGGSGEGLEN